MQEFLSRTDSMGKMLELLKNKTIRDMIREYPEIDYFDQRDLIGCMQDVYDETKIPFIIIIDEWDCIFREYRSETEAQKMYLDFLRDMLKDKGYIALCYMTGILPIKKYGTHSALNMFDEFSMTFQGELAPYVGFTEDEVRGLCERYDMDFEETKWNQTAESTITQIKEKCYPKALEDYKGNLLLVGISYDEKTKEHDCKIEPYSM